MTRVLVTGGSGFIGTNLLLALVDRGCEVLSLDPRPPRCSSLGGVTEITDPLDKSSIARKVLNFQPDYVYHLGARTDLSGDSIEDYSENILGLSNVIEAIQLCPGIQGAFFASSRLVCKIGYQPQSEFDYCPTTAYGESKVHGELLVRKSDLEVPWCIFRPTSIWGPWFDIPYKTFFLTVAANRYIHPRGRQVRKSFGFIGNSVYQLIKLMEMNPTSYRGKTFYLCDHPTIEVGSWADAIAREIGVRLPRRVPLSLLRIIATAGDLASLMGMKNPPLTNFRLNNLITQMEMDSSFVREQIGELPFSSEDGVRITVEWLRNSGQVK